MTSEELAESLRQNHKTTEQIPFPQKLNVIKESAHTFCN